MSDSDFSHNTKLVKQSLLSRIETDVARMVRLEATDMARGMTKELRADLEKRSAQYTEEWERTSVFDTTITKIRDLVADADDPLANEICAVLEQMDATFEALAAAKEKRGPGRPRKTEDDYSAAS